MATDRFAPHGRSLGQHGQAPLQRRLTKMYSDTKKSYESVTEPPRVEIASELTQLHRKLQVQKNRLIAWGWHWSDRSSPDIDESLERAGIGEVVAGILSSIKAMLEEAENIRYSSAKEGANDGGASPERKKASWKDHWTPADRSRFEDLLLDLTQSIDLLHDLSKSRAASSRQALSLSKSDASSIRTLPEYSEKQDQILNPFLNLTTASNPVESAPQISRKPLHDLRLSFSSLIIPEHERSPSQRPPPYEAVACPPSSRVMGYYREMSGPMATENTPRTQLTPVLIDYAAMDPVYHCTGIYPSTSRLEALADAMQSSRNPGNLGTMRLLGYFEDPKTPRYGLVYLLPADYASQTSIPLDLLAPTPLLQLLHEKSSGTSIATPPLDDRFQLARNLAMYLMQLHAAGVMHRDINSNNIVFFRKLKSSSSPGLREWTSSVRHPFYINFDLFTEYEPDGHLNLSPSNLYRHPNDARLGKSDKSFANFEPCLDIYSLGLVLLEIGLWMPLSGFRRPDQNTPTLKGSTISTLVKKLAARCGVGYMHVVQSCLTFADEAPKETGGMTKQRNLQAEFYWQVLRRLDRCCVIDDEESQHPASAPSFMSSEQDTVPSGGTSTIPQKSFSEPSLHLDSRKMGSSPLVVASMVGDRAVSEDGREGNTSLPALPAEEEVDPKTTVIRKLRVFQVDVSKDILDQWHKQLLPRLERLVEKASKDYGDTFTIDLVGVGESAETARPTIAVTTPRAGRIKAVLNRYFTYDKDLFDLKVRKGRLRRSFAFKLPRKRRQVVRPSAADDSDEEVENPHYYEKPVCGASIGAWRSGSHSLAVSFGGVVMVDGEPHGMTVHHMLEPPSDDESDSCSSDFCEGPTVNRASARPPSGPFDLTEQDETSPTSDEAYDGGYITDVSEEEEEIESDEEFEETFQPRPPVDSGLPKTPGDAPGKYPGDDEDVPVTQPAFQDVSEDFFPEDENADAEHLMSHRLGEVYASSGIRRWNKYGVDHEIDWALFKIDDDRLQPHNLVAGGRRFCRSQKGVECPKLEEPVARLDQFRAKDDLFPREVAPVDKLGKLRVHSFGRTTGLRRGEISPAMSSVKVAGRTTSSRSWNVLGGLGVPGDSGAWVIDDEQGRVCGHVLAWCDSTRRAYICPMQILFQDMERTLHRQISLPDAVEASAKLNVPNSASGLRSGAHPDLSSVHLSSGSETPPIPARRAASPLPRIKKTPAFLGARIHSGRARTASPPHSPTLEILTASTPARHRKSIATQGVVAALPSPEPTPNQWEKSRRSSLTFPTFFGPGPLTPLSVSVSPKQHQQEGPQQQQHQQMAQEIS